MPRSKMDSPSQSLYPARMSKPINLNQARKAKARAAQQRKAEANAVKFGRSKAQKSAEAAKAARVQRLFDAHKRDRE